MSCQKDNELTLNNSDNQSQVDLKKSYAGEHDFQLDPLTNYPDPFYGSTTIAYHLKINSRVRLMAYFNDHTYVVILVDQIQAPGTYEVVFDASALPPGEYTAQLKIGNKVYYESMTKRKKWDVSEVPAAEN
jgi:hypothetical protein